jgi:hypothetical protein
MVGEYNPIEAKRLRRAFNERHGFVPGDLVVTPDGLAMGYYQCVSAHKKPGVVTVVLSGAVSLCRENLGEVNEMVASARLLPSVVEYNREVFRVDTSSQDLSDDQGEWVKYHRKPMPLDDPRIVASWAEAVLDKHKYPHKEVFQKSRTIRMDDSDGPWKF